ncbi:MAG TPA: hypothetical protein PKV16_02425 [Caldisericia bacterium]|nr:hypothetical protein [Caldisericia bacterium]HPF48170.1 hypothetical protein [Caldisericia bacterium]HPI83894.1 hypothetical protein [Caldisericia bacterium]HPQ92623.1 hypothetical protein [Caldisericia bacterium]HRV74279.1 hypothetical protein [Caldisericia bacterium]
MKCKKCRSDSVYPICESCANQDELELISRLKEIDDEIATERNEVKQLKGEKKQTTYSIWVAFAIIALGLLPTNWPQIPWLLYTGYAIITLGAAFLLYMVYETWRTHKNAWIAFFLLAGGVGLIWSNNIWGSIVGLLLLIPGIIYMVIAIIDLWPEKLAKMDYYDQAKVRIQRLRDEKSVLLRKLK